MPGQVPSRLQQSFVSWKERKSSRRSVLTPSIEGTNDHLEMFDSVSFPLVLGQNGRLRATTQAGQQFQVRSHSSRGKSRSRIMSSCSAASVNSERRPKPEKTSQGHIWRHAAPGGDLDSILSLHIPMHYLEPNTNKILR